MVSGEWPWFMGQVRGEVLNILFFHLLMKVCIYLEKL